jgi:hypothetical protein
LKNFVALCGNFFVAKKATDFLSQHATFCFLSHRAADKIVVSQFMPNHKNFLDIVCNPCQNKQLHKKYPLPKIPSPNFKNNKNKKTMQIHTFPSAILYNKYQNKTKQTNSEL